MFESSKSLDEIACQSHSNSGWEDRISKSRIDLEINVCPSFVGSAGFAIHDPYLAVTELTLLPQLESNVTV